MEYDEWVGKIKNQHDSMAPEQLRRFEAMLNRPPDDISMGSELTMCAHWAYFTPLYMQSELGVQGYPRTETFLPPVPYATRLWTGGRISFVSPLHIGTPANKHSTITSLAEKESSGEKRVHLTLQNQISTKGSLAVSEDQHFLYRDPTEKGAHPTRTQPMDLDPDWEKSTKPDSVLLFRFSALTYNAHRIHYDQEYARSVEGYPNVMLHGQLLLLLALESFRSKFDGKVLEEVTYKLNGPVYLGELISIAGKSVDNHRSELRICGPEKNIALRASVKWGYKW